MRSITHSIVTAAVALAFSGASPVGAQTEQNPWAASGPARGKYADVNGIKLYYEIHGSGRPLVLLHGGLGAGSMFGSNVPALAKNHQVILVDLQGHGRTVDIDRPIDPALMADDIAALLAYLRIDKADVLGYSLGGGVALQTAARHPALVRKLVLVSAPVRADAFYPDLRAQQKAVAGSMAEQMKGTPMYELYMSVAPRKQDFPRLLDKVGEFMRKGYDYTPQFAALQVPTLIVAGDADMFPPSYAAEMFALLDGGKRDGGWDGAGQSKRARLAILPGVTHYTSFAAPALWAVTEEFLK